MLQQEFYRPVLCDRLIVRCGITTEGIVIVCVTIVRDAAKNGLTNRYKCVAEKLAAPVFSSVPRLACSVPRLACTLGHKTPPKRLYISTGLTGYMKHIPEDTQSLRDQISKILVV